MTMDILNLIRISAKALMRNKTRTALSMLGIVIGIAAVIAVVNLGEGLKQSTANQLSDMGTNLIMVMRAKRRCQYGLVKRAVVESQGL